MTSAPACRIFWRKSRNLEFRHHPDAETVALSRIAINYGIVVHAAIHEIEARTLGCKLRLQVSAARSDHARCRNQPAHDRHHGLVQRRHDRGSVVTEDCRGIDICSVIEAAYQRRHWSLKQGCIRRRLISLVPLHMRLEFRCRVRQSERRYVDLKG